jgi:hypothetical protein
MLKNTVQVSNLHGVSDQAGHGPLVQVDGVLPFGGKEELLDLLWSDRDGLAVGAIIWCQSTGSQGSKGRIWTSQPPPTSQWCCLHGSSLPQCRNKHA